MALEKPNNRRRADSSESNRATEPGQGTEPSRSSAHDAEPTVGVEEMTAAAVDEPQPEREAVAHRAYELYLDRGGQDGRDVDDWLRAERELGIQN